LPASPGAIVGRRFFSGIYFLGLTLIDPDRPHGDGAERWSTNSVRFY